MTGLASGLMSGATGAGTAGATGAAASGAAGAAGAGSGGFLSNLSSGLGQSLSTSGAASPAGQSAAGQAQGTLGQAVGQQMGSQMSPQVKSLASMIGGGQASPTQGAQSTAGAVSNNSQGNGWFGTGLFKNDGNNPTPGGAPTANAGVSQGVAQSALAKTKAAPNLLQQLGFLPMQ